MSTILCSISGLPIQHIDGFKDKTFLFPSNEHQFFSIPLLELEKLASQSSTERRTKLETRLLFLAFLKKTNLVAFQFPALPSDSLCLTKLQALQDFVLELHRLALRKEQIINLFPRLVISLDTSCIENFADILDAWVHVLKCQFPKPTQAPTDSRWVAPSKKQALVARLQNALPKKAKEPTKKEYEWLISLFNLEQEQEYNLASVLKYPRLLTQKNLTEIITIINDRLENYTENKIKFISWYAEKRAEGIEMQKAFLPLEAPTNEAKKLHYGFSIVENSAANSIKRADFASLKNYLIAVRNSEEGVL